MIKLCKVGLALGGGGARGLAHIGVLRALEEAGIVIDRIAGTSMGALVAAVYALYPKGDLVTKKFRLYLQSREFQRTNPEFLHLHDFKDLPKLEGIFLRFTNYIKKGFFYTQSLTRRAPISEENFAQNINFLLDDVDIQKTQIPLAIIALDLKSAAEVVLKKGSLRLAVSASCAIPGILPPIKWEGQELVDGGWINRVPVRPVREMGADLVVAVEVAEGLEEDPEDLNSGLGIFLKANEISRHALSRWQMKEADVVITPDVTGIHWSDFGHLDLCLRAGEEATQEKLETIKRLIRRKKLKKFFFLPSFRFPFS